MKKTVQFAVYALTICCSVFLIVAGNRFFRQSPYTQTVYDKETELNTAVYATIASIEAVEQDDTVPETTIFFTARTFGMGQPQTVQGKQILNEGTRNTAPVAPGDRVVLLSYGDGLLFQYFFRFDKILVIGALFALLLLFLGGFKGFNTMVALLFTCLSIFLVFIPAIASGRNIYLCAIAVCAYIVSMTFIIVYGCNAKSLISALSCLVGVGVSGLLAFAADRWMKLTGYINENMYMLGRQLGFDIDVKALIFAMILIGALGAIMDVSMSITSALCELKDVNPGAGTRALLQSGMNIGRDMLGTMTNTLVLAYVGTSLVTVLLYASSNYPLLSVLSKEEIIYEFMQSLIGSFSLLLTIPFTAYITAILLNRR